jgi:hypothetical protein
MNARTRITITAAALLLAAATSLLAEDRDLDARELLHVRTLEGRASQPAPGEKRPEPAAADRRPVSVARGARAEIALADGTWCASAATPRCSSRSSPGDREERDPPRPEDGRSS